MSKNLYSSDQTVPLASLQVTFEICILHYIFIIGRCLQGALSIVYFVLYLTFKKNKVK